MKKSFRKFCSHIVPSTDCSDLFTFYWVIAIAHLGTLLLGIQMRFSLVFGVLAQEFCYLRGLTTPKEWYSTHNAQHTTPRAHNKYAHSARININYTLQIVHTITIHEYDHTTEQMLCSQSEKSKRTRITTT